MHQAENDPTSRHVRRQMARIAQKNLRAERAAVSAPKKPATPHITHAVSLDKRLAMTVGAGLAAAGAVFFAVSQQGSSNQESTASHIPAVITRYENTSIQKTLLDAAHAQGYVDNTDEKSRWIQTAFPDVPLTVDANDPTYAKSRVEAVLTAMEASANPLYLQASAYVKLLQSRSEITMEYPSHITSPHGTQQEATLTDSVDGNHIVTHLQLNAHLINAPSSILKPADVADMLVEQTTRIQERRAYLTTVPATVALQDKINVNTTRLHDPAEHLAESTKAYAVRAFAHRNEVGLLGGIDLSGTQSNYLSGLLTLAGDNMQSPIFIGAVQGVDSR